MADKLRDLLDRDAGVGEHRDEGAPQLTRSSLPRVDDRHQTEGAAPAPGRAFALEGPYGGPWQRMSYRTANVCNPV
jgi:hypothetical protein